MLSDMAYVLIAYGVTLGAAGTFAVMALRRYRQVSRALEQPPADGV